MRTVPSRRDAVKTELREAALGDMGCSRVGYLTGAGAPTILYPAVRLDRFPFHDGLQRCRACGCTEEDCSACAERTGEPCGWVEPDLCSACADRNHRTGYDGAWDIEDEWCETCHGTGIVSCHCGGDLCVCRNHGEMPCPSC